MFDLVFKLWACRNSDFASTTIENDVYFAYRDRLKNGFMLHGES